MTLVLAILVLWILSSIGMAWYWSRLQRGGPQVLPMSGLPHPFEDERYPGPIGDYESQAIGSTGGLRATVTAEVAREESVVEALNNTLMVLADAASVLEDMPVGEDRNALTDSRDSMAYALKQVQYAETRLQGLVARLTEAQRV